MCVTIAWSVRPDSGAVSLSDTQASFICLNTNEMPLHKLDTNVFSMNFKDNLKYVSVPRERSKVISNNNGNSKRV